MYQNNISTLQSLARERYENIFKLHIDEDGRYFYNLIQNVIFPDNLPDGFFNSYDVVPGDTLPFISYKIYRSIHLWWVICLVNKIDNPTIKLEPGTKLKILKDDTVKLLIRELNS
jgi:hypothetical protein